MSQGLAKYLTTQQQRDASVLATGPGILGPVVIVLYSPLSLPYPFTRPLVY